jgi:pterin-4a-carbinolamine dehydratase
VRVVWKQPLKLTEKRQEFLVKGFEKVVHVALQSPSEDITVWYLADPESNFYETVAFQIFGTGDQAIPERAEHRGHHPAGLVRLARLRGAGAR